MSRELELITETNDYPQHQIDKALTYTEWSWYDVMTAFREIGYDPTEAEEQRIKRALFTKKIKHITKDT